MTNPCSVSSTMRSGSIKCRCRHLAFVARRLMAEPVALVFAVRDRGAEVLAGLPELVISGLSDGDARELLESVMLGGIDPRVRDRIVAETRGIPLAILEVPRNVSATELAGGFWISGRRPSAGADRGKLRAPHPVPPRADPTVAARRGGRAGGRRCVVSARSGAAGHSGRRAGACRGRGSDRVRSAHALSPPVDALGRLPRGRSDRPQGHTSGVGRCNRSAVRPRPSGMARRQRRGGTRRCGGRGAGSLSRPRPEQGRHRRGGSFLGARDRVDIGPGPTWCQGARGRTGQTGRGGAGGGARAPRNSRTRAAVRPSTGPSGSAARPDGVRAQPRR